MLNLLSLLTIFVSFGFSLSANASEERCLVSNLRFDQNSRLYDFMVVEPDFFYVTTVVGYVKVNGNLEPAVNVDQEFKRAEKGFGFKSTYTTDKTLSQKTIQENYFFRGKVKRDSYLEEWELITDARRMPLKLTRNVTLKNGTVKTFNCDSPATSAFEWYSLPFASEVVGYNVLPSIPNIQAE